MIKKYKQFLNEGILQHLKGPNKEELWNNIKNFDPDKLLDKSMEYGIFDGVVKAFEESDRLLKGGNRYTINVYYIKFEYLDNFNEEEAYYIIKRFIDKFDLGSLLQKSIVGNSMHGVKFVFNPILSEDERTKERELKKIEEFESDKNYYISSGLSTCVKHNNYKMLKILLDNSNAELKIPNECINYACEKNMIDIVKLLVEHGADINQKGGGYPLINACENGNVRIVDYLIDNGADINVRGGHALDTAAMEGYTDVVRLLIKRGADIHQSTEYALGISVYSGYYEQAKELLELGADINNAKYNFIDYGIKKGSPEMKELIKKYLNNDKEV